MCCLDPIAHIPKHVLPAWSCEISSALSPLHRFPFIFFIFILACIFVFTFITLKSLVFIAVNNSGMKLSRANFYQFICIILHSPWRLCIHCILRQYGGLICQVIVTGWVCMCVYERECGESKLPPQPWLQACCHLFRSLEVLLLPDQ